MCNIYTLHHIDYTKQLIHDHGWHTTGYHSAMNEIWLLSKRSSFQIWLHFHHVDIIIHYQFRLSCNDCGWHQRCHIDLFDVISGGFQKMFQAWFHLIFWLIWVARIDSICRVVKLHNHPLFRNRLRSDYIFSKRLWKVFRTTWVKSPPDAATIS